MPGGFLAHALAGAATGAGKGLVNEARAKREMVMEELREQRLMAREDRQFGRQMQLAQTQNQWQAERDERQHEFGMERDAFRHSLNTTGLGGVDGEAMPAAGLTSDQQRQIDLIMQRYADFDAMSGNYVVNDWDGLRQALLRVDGGEQYYRQLFGEPPRPATPSELATPQPMPQDRSQLVDGQTYRLGDGTEAVFNGREGVFEAVDGEESPQEGEAPSSTRDGSTRSRGDQRQGQTRRDRVAENNEAFRQSPLISTIRDAAQGPLTQTRDDGAWSPEEMPQYGRDTATGTVSGQAPRDPLQDMNAREAEREISNEIAQLRQARRSGRLGEVEYRRRVLDLQRRAQRFGLDIEDIE